MVSVNSDSIGTFDYALGHDQMKMIHEFLKQYGPTNKQMSEMCFCYFCSEQKKARGIIFNKNNEI